jgi:hypothetical protein
MDMEAAGFSTALAPIYQTTRCDVSEDRNHRCRQEELIAYFLYCEEGERVSFVGRFPGFVRSSFW